MPVESKQVLNFNITQQNFQMDLSTFSEKAIFM